MSAPVVIRFVRLGRARVPTVALAIRMREDSPRLAEACLVDTGSDVSVFSEDLLRLNGFPTHAGREVADGLDSIAGNTRLFYLEGAAAAVRGEDGVMHHVNLPRLHFTREVHVPILGRDVLRRFNAVMTMDFNRESGAIAVG